MSFVGNVLGSLISGGMQADSSRYAVNTQNDATRAALAEQQRQFDLSRSDLAPYRQAGVDALGQLQTQINAPTTAADVMSDPGYQFGLDQGQLGLDRKAAAAGGRVSGAALKAASQYATDYATTGYNAAYQRRQDRLNRLATLAGVGQTATGTGVAAGAGTANAVSGLLTSQGDAAAAGRLAQGNIWGNTANRLGAALGTWASAPSAGGYGSVPGGYVAPDGSQFNNPSAYTPGG